MKATYPIRKQIRREMQNRNELNAERITIELQYCELGDIVAENRQTVLAKTHGVPLHKIHKQISKGICPRGISGEVYDTIRQGIKEAAKAAQKMKLLQDQHYEIKEEMKTYELKAIAARYNVSQSALFDATNGRIGWK